MLTVSLSNLKEVKKQTVCLFSWSLHFEGYCRNGEGPTLLYLNFLGKTFIRNQGEYFRWTFVKMKNEKYFNLKIENRNETQSI